MEFTTPVRCGEGMLFKDPTTHLLTKIVCGCVSNRTAIVTIDIASYKSSELATFRGKCGLAGICTLKDYRILFSYKGGALALLCAERR